MTASLYERHALRVRRAAFAATKWLTKGTRCVYEEQLSLLRMTASLYERHALRVRRTAFTATKDVIVNYVIFVHASRVFRGGLPSFVPRSSLS